MQSLSPTSRYQQALNEGSHQPDDVQHEAVRRLDSIWQALTTQPAEAAPAGGLKAAFGRLLGKKAPQSVTPVRGLYMWGGVGRGKTWLMDLFYQSLPGTRKQRLHFHRFMLRVHEELTACRDRAIRWISLPSVSKPKPTCCASMSFLSLTLPTPCCWAG